MSGLDEHVAAVRNRLALCQFVTAAAWGAMILSAAVVVAVLADRIFMLHPPRPALWLAGGTVASCLTALVYALYRRPDPHQAAVAIDLKLGLKEKISTALYARTSDDPFALAVVRDAELTARSLTINLSRHFPLSLPRPAYAAVVLSIVAVLSYFLIDPMNLFSRRQRALQQAMHQQKVEDARMTLQQALASVQSMPALPGVQPALQKAANELQAALDQPIDDPDKAKRTAVRVLQDVWQALKEQTQTQQAQAQAQSAMLRSLQDEQDQPGPLDNVRQAMSQEDFNRAADALGRAVENFAAMDKSEQRRAATQMGLLADKLHSLASDTAQAQKLQQQLQQLGMDARQAQQARQLVEQSARGDQQASQQLDQMLGQMDYAPEQLPQMQQMMRLLGAQVQAAQQAQQMSTSARQLAQAMQKMSEASERQSQQARQAEQQMQQAMQQMRSQMQQMQQCRQVLSALGQACRQVESARQGKGLDGAALTPYTGPALAGSQHVGIVTGTPPERQNQPTVESRLVPADSQPPVGRILASSFIKDNMPIRGQSALSLKEVAEAALAQQSDEVDQQRISRQAEAVVREYFDTMQKD